MRFMIFGDSKGNNYGINSEVLTDILLQSKRLDPKPEFIVVCGDSVAGSSDESLLASQLNNFKDLMQKYHPGKLILPVVGNHEVNSCQVDDRYEKTFSCAYGSLNTDGFLDNYNKTAYYIDFSETRLIVLNAFHYNSLHKIDKTQLSWFEAAASVNKKNKFVFVHSPAFPTGAHLGHCLDLYPESRDAFWQTAERCQIDIIFSGHEHNYSRRLINPVASRDENSNVKGIYQIITGGGGEKLKDKLKSSEGLLAGPIKKHHFIVVDVTEKGINISAINSHGKKLDEFMIQK
jgi:3',5'-cyclic-AMP phosphodiesterase